DGRMRCCSQPQRVVSTTPHSPCSCGAYERHRTAAHGAVALDAHDAMHRFTRALDLDAAQQAAIAQILARHQGELDSTWHAVQPHVRATLDSTHQEIVGVLKPDQVVKYRQMMEAAHPTGHR